MRQMSQLTSWLRPCERPQARGPGSAMPRFLSQKNREVINACGFVSLGLGPREQTQGSSISWNSAKAIVGFPLYGFFYPRKGYFINSLFRIQTKKYIQLKSEAPLHPSLTTNRTPPPKSNHTVLSTLRTFLHICRHIRKFINNEQGTPYIHFCDLLLSFNSLSWISPWRYIKEASPAFLPMTSQHSEG